MFDSFEGVKIYVYDFDHSPPHFHARYAEYEVLVVIQTLEILRGTMPPAKLRRILKWARQNQQDLLTEFQTLNPYLRS